MEMKMFERQSGRVLFCLVTWAICVLVVGSAQAAITTGLQSYWALDGNGEDSQGTVDLAAQENGATVGYVTGLVGQALSVPKTTGTGSYMESIAAAGDYSVVHEITVSLWYKQTLAIPNGTVYQMGQPGYPELAMYTGGGDGNGVGMVDRDGAGAVSVTIPGGFEEANIWQHRVLRISNLNHVMDQWYARVTAVDHGSADSTGSIYASPDIKAADFLKIGWNKSTNSDYMFDEVAIWNRALSDTEIETVFDMGKAGMDIYENVPDPPYPPSTFLLGDANGDGVVSAGDYAAVQANFGNTLASSQSAVTPEPATMSLLAVGLLAIVRRHRR
jgi:hypothetical protein